MACRSTPKSRRSTTCASTSRTPSPRRTSARSWPRRRSTRGSRRCATRPATCRRKQQLAELKAEESRAAGPAQDDVATTAFESRGDNHETDSVRQAVHHAVVIWRSSATPSGTTRARTCAEWAGGQERRHGRRQRHAGVVHDDFDALKNAPPDPGRNAASTGVTGGAVGSGQARPPAGRRHQHLGRPRAGHRRQRRPRPERRARIYKTKYGLDVKFVLLEDPAAKLAAFRKGDVDIMWDTVDNWAREASMLAEQNQQGQVDHHAGLVARRRRHRLARDASSRSRT